MSIQNLNVEITPEKSLKITWITMVKVEAVQVSAALDSEFTKNTCNFLLPEQASGCVLDLGKGTWYVRVGGWVGSSLEGTVQWSGILGPIPLSSEKATIVPQISQFLVQATKQLEGGFRLYRSTTFDKIMCLEISTHSSFPASDTRFTYVKDDGRGFADVHGLHHEMKYYIRYSILSAIPTRDMVQIPTGNVERQVKSLPPADIKVSSERTQLKSDLRFLEEARTKKNVRFSSYSDYIRYMAAKSSH